MPRRARDLIRSLRYYLQDGSEKAFLVDQPRGRTDLHVPVRLSGRTYWGRAGGNDGHFQDSTIRAANSAGLIELRSPSRSDLPDSVTKASKPEYGVFEIGLTNLGRTATLRAAR